MRYLFVITQFIVFFGVQRKRCAQKRCDSRFYDMRAKGGAAEREDDVTENNLEISSVLIYSIQKGY